MPTTNVPVSNLPGYFPHIDSRAYERPVVIDGRNFAWDAAGPYSAFATRLLVDTTSVEEAPYVTQSLVFEDITYIAALDDIYDISGGSWSSIHTFSAVPNPYTIDLNEWKWTSDFLGGDKYICNPTRGIYRIDAGPVLADISAISGMPSNVIQICESNGRMCYLNATHFTWSAPNDPENLTPTLGGAGQQLLADRIAGTPFAMTPLRRGVIVWTTKGGLLCEFIGGDSVFRYDVMDLDAIPLNAFALDELHDGSHVMATRLGLYRIGPVGETEELTPQFNTFLREQWLSQPNIQPCLYYSLDENSLYVSIRDTTAYFNNTYHLNMSLDKWGRFSVPHLGIFKYEFGRGKIGYMGVNGVAHRFLPRSLQGGNRETISGYDGLDSYIDIGYIRAPNLISNADTLQELQAIKYFRKGGIEQTNVDEGDVLSGQTSVIDEGDDLTAPITVEFDESEELILQVNAAYGIEVHVDAEAIDMNDGFTIYPQLALSNLQSDLWTCMSNANYHKIRLTAYADGEYYHLRHMAVTLGYHGLQA